MRYILEGSVRRAGNRLRITAQLVDATTGGHLWAERYERELGDIFAVQDDITRSVAAAIEPRLLAAEGIRALARSPQHLGAWELVAQAQTHFWRMSRADHEAAIEPLRQAIEAHPDYAPAHGRLGFCLVFAAHMGWVGAERGLLAGREHAMRAIALDDCDPWGHIALGYWAMMERRTEESIAAFRQAVSLNPNSAAAHSHLSRGFAFAGRDGEAIEHGNEAIRLSPLDPEMALFLGAIAVAHYTAGRYDQAAHFTTEALRLRPGFQGAQRLRCASLARAGRVEEARAFLADGAPRAATAVARVGSRQRSLSDARADGPVRRRPAPGRTALAAAEVRSAPHLGDLDRLVRVVGEHRHHVRLVHGGDTQELALAAIDLRLRTWSAHPRGCSTTGCRARAGHRRAPWAQTVILRPEVAHAHPFQEARVLGLGLQQGLGLLRPGLGRSGLVGRVHRRQQSHEAEMAMPR